MRTQEPIRNKCMPFHRINCTFQIQLKIVVDSSNLFLAVNKEQKILNGNKRLSNACKQKQAIHSICGHCIDLLFPINVTKNTPSIHTKLHRFYKREEWKNKRLQKERKNQSLNEFVKQFYRSANMQCSNSNTSLCIWIC